VTHSINIGFNNPNTTNTINMPQINGQEIGPIGFGMMGEYLPQLIHTYKPLVNGKTSS